MPFFVGDSLMAHAKAGCYRCGRGDHLVDMDVQIEGEGALALCRGCIGDAAEAARLHLNDAAVQELRAELVAAQAAADPERIASLEAKIAEQDDIIRISEGVIESLESVLASLTEPEDKPAPKAKRS